MPRSSRRIPPFVSNRGQYALTVVLLYACFSALWILLSDKAVDWLLAEDLQQRLMAQTLKGWLFVAVTSILLYLALLRSTRSTPTWPGQEPEAETPPRETLPWLAIGLLAVTIVVVTGLNIHDRYREKRHDAENQLRAIGLSKAEQIAAWHRERWNEALGVQHSVGLPQYWLMWARESTPQARQGVQERLRRIALSGQFDRVEVIDAEGRGINDPEFTELSSAADLLSGVRKAIAAGQVQRDGPRLDADGQARLRFLAPIALSFERPAVVVMHLDLPPYFHPALKDWPLPGESAEAVLVAQRGEEVVFLSALKRLPDAAPHVIRPLSDPWLPSARVLRGEAAPGEMMDGRDYAGVPVYAMVLPVGDTGWWLLVKQDRSELMAEAVRGGLTIALSGILAIFALGVGVYLYVQRRRLNWSARHIDELRAVRERLQASEARYRLLAENGSDVVWLLDLATERLLYISPSVERHLGYTPEEMLGKDLDDILTPESLAAVRKRLPERLRAFAAGDESARSQTDQLEEVHRDGHRIPVEIVSTLITDAQGQPVQLQGVTRDITARQQAEAKILQLSQAMEQSPAGVILTDLQGRIEYVNAAFERMSGYTRQEVLGQNPRILRSGQTPREVYEAMWRSLHAGETWHGEIVNRHKSGKDYVQAVTIAPVRDPSGHITHYLSVQLDITAQRHAEDMAHQLSWFDLLTGLPNRRHLLRELAETLSGDRRNHRLSALLLVNIDRFKTLNDALGHAAGDRLLKRLGERFSTLTRAGLVLAHLGADEFALLMHGNAADEDAVSQEAMRLAEVVHDLLKRPFSLPDRPDINVTASIGVTVLPHHFSDTPSEVLRRADTALHRAKHGGGNQTAFFDAAMGQAVGQRFAIEQDLRRGLSAGELRLYLQPQATAAGEVVSAEALVRWAHPEQGLLPPGVFIPVAEDSGLIAPLGQWVLREVCQHLGQLRREGLRLPIAVNISPQQFHQTRFTPDLLDLLQATGAAPEDLILEITESVVVERIDDVIERMKALNRHGVRFSIDDFGTGYSSLSYLKSLPIHEIKIDRSFVQDAPHDPSDAALVEAILSVARHLQLRVVAEGVETPEHAAFFRNHAEVLLQGYLFGRPEPAADVIARWRQDRRSPSTGPAGGSGA